MKDNHVSDRPGDDRGPGLFVALGVALALVLAIAIASVQSTSAQPNTCGNGVLDTGEDCDLTSPSGAFCPPGEVCTTSCDCAFVATTTTPTTTVVATTTTLPHFQCYELRKSASPPHAGVTVQDQFGTTSGLTLSKSNRLCAPASKNGEEPTAPSLPDHLKAYQDKHRATTVVNQTIVNQFGTILVDVSKPSFVFVPASKGLTSAPPPLTGSTVDHFQCYKVKRSRGAPAFTKISGVTVQDQFGTASITLLRPRWLCAPANKNGEDPTAPTHPGHLLCYKSRNNSSFADRTGFSDDQFGTDQFTIHRRTEFCVPSLKNPTGTTTTSTSTSTVTTTSHTTTTGAVVTTSTSSTSSSTTTSTLYGSPSRAFVEPVRSLLE